MSVTITLADDIDISRGDMIVPQDDVPRESTTLEVMLCWMNQRPLQVNGKYAVKHTTRDVRCVVKEVRYILNINTLDKQEEEKIVKLNDIACVVLQTTKPLFFDPYSVNRITGSLILIDESTNETMGAGMIL
jgi:sulfate adenylyltransferase subunit 1